MRKLKKRSGIKMVSVYKVLPRPVFHHLIPDRGFPAFHTGDPVEHYHSYSTLERVLLSIFD